VKVNYATKKKNETSQLAEISKRNEKEQRKGPKLAPEDAILKIQSGSRGIFLGGNCISTEK